MNDIPVLSQELGGFVKSYLELLAYESSELGYSSDDNLKIRIVKLKCDIYWRFLNNLNLSYWKVRHAILSSTKDEFEPKLGPILSTIIIPDLESISGILRLYALKLLSWIVCSVASMKINCGLLQCSDSSKLSLLLMPYLSNPFKLSIRSDEHSTDHLKLVLNILYTVISGDFGEGHMTYRSPFFNKLKHDMLMNRSTIINHLDCCVDIVDHHTRLSCVDSVILHTLATQILMQLKFWEPQLSVDECINTVNEGNADSTVNINHTDNVVAVDQGNVQRLILSLFRAALHALSQHEWNCDTHPNLSATEMKVLKRYSWSAIFDNCMQLLETAHAAAHKQHKQDIHRAFTQLEAHIKNEVESIMKTVSEGLIKELSHRRLDDAFMNSDDSCHATRHTYKESRCGQLYRFCTKVLLMCSDSNDATNDTMTQPERHYSRFLEFLGLLVPHKKVGVLTQPIGAIYAKCSSGTIATGLTEVSLFIRRLAELLIWSDMEWYRYNHLLKFFRNNFMTLLSPSLESRFALKKSSSSLQRDDYGGKASALYITVLRNSVSALVLLLREIRPYGSISSDGMHQVLLSTRARSQNPSILSSALPPSQGFEVLDSLIACVQQESFIASSIGANVDLERLLMHAELTLTLLSAERRLLATPVTSDILQAIVASVSEQFPASCVELDLSQDRESTYEYKGLVYSYTSQQAAFANSKIDAYTEQRVYSNGLFAQQSLSKRSYFIQRNDINFHFTGESAVPSSSTGGVDCALLAPRRVVELLTLNTEAILFVNKAYKALLIQYESNHSAVTLLLVCRCEYLVAKHVESWQIGINAIVRYHIDSISHSSSCLGAEEQKRKRQKVQLNEDDHEHGVDLVLTPDDDGESHFVLRVDPAASFSEGPLARDIRDTVHALYHLFSKVWTQFFGEHIQNEHEHPEILAKKLAPLIQFELYIESFFWLIHRLSLYAVAGPSPSPSVNSTLSHDADVADASYAAFLNSMLGLLLRLAVSYADGCQKASIYIAKHSSQLRSYFSKKVEVADAASLAFLDRFALKKVIKAFEYRDVLCEFNAIKWSFHRCMRGITECNLLVPMLEWMSKCLVSDGEMALLSRTRDAHFSGGKSGDAGVAQGPLLLARDAEGGACCQTSLIVSLMSECVSMTSHLLCAENPAAGGEAGKNFSLTPETFTSIKGTLDVLISLPLSVISNGRLGVHLLYKKLELKSFHNSSSMSYLDLAGACEKKAANQAADKDFDNTDFAKQWKQLVRLWLTLRAAEYQQRSQPLSTDAAPIIFDCSAKTVYSPTKYLYHINSRRSGASIFLELAGNLRLLVSTAKVYEEIQKTSHERLIQLQSCILIYNANIDMSSSRVNDATKSNCFLLSPISPLKVQTSHISNYDMSKLENELNYYNELTQLGFQLTCLAVTGVCSWCEAVKDSARGRHSLTGGDCCVSVSVRGGCESAQDKAKRDLYSMLVRAVESVCSLITNKQCGLAGYFHDVYKRLEWDAHASRLRSAASDGSELLNLIPPEQGAKDAAKCRKVVLGKPISVLFQILMNTVLESLPLLCTRLLATSCVSSDPESLAFEAEHADICRACFHWSKYILATIFKLTYSIASSAVATVDESCAMLLKRSALDFISELVLVRQQSNDLCTAVTCDGRSPSHHSVWIMRQWLELMEYCEEFWKDLASAVLGDVKFPAATATVKKLNNRVTKPEESVTNISSTNKSSFSEPEYLKIKGPSLKEQTAQLRLSGIKVKQGVVPATYTLADRMNLNALSQSQNECPSQHIS